MGSKHPRYPRNVIGKWVMFGTRRCKPGDGSDEDCNCQRLTVTPLTNHWRVDPDTASAF
ncbi:hypothetical protein AG1IA_01820 [Rhizoctonia solani AG-1 IA]|uniref:Uncharacterized protein n=1 Tax=Thanatephorus cucumeris (strain AG1-IA) TaxID=983506 RepID=L8X679_THACA|nr:hypothetical protein AG1IA_01820 [Rhizoctonia solani AG-1 IA]